MPQAVLAQSPDDERWRDEIDFELTEPVEGRRIFVEGLTVSAERAAVTLRAATDIDIRVRAFGGSQGTALRFWGSATLAEGERIDYSLPLNGPVPSFTVSWEDTLGQAGAITVESEQIPYPLPEVEGELCDLRVASLGWRPGAVSGVVESECVTTIEHPVELQTVAGHESVTQTTIMEAGVTAISGTIDATIGASVASVAFVPDGETSFRLSVPTGEAIHDVTLDASLEASLSIPIPPLTVLTHHPERTEQVTKTVQLHRPGDSDSDTQTATAACEDGTTETVTATAYAHVPSATITKEVTVDVLHKEHVKAEVGGAGAAHPHPRGEPGPCAARRGVRRPLRRPGPAGAGTRGPARRAVARERAARMVRAARMGVALVRRFLTAILLAGAALVSTGAAPEEEQAMLDAFDSVLTAMAYAAAGLAVFAIAWAGFVLMAEGSEERGGRAKSAVVLAVVGLVLVLSAKGVAALLKHGLLPSIPTP